MHTHVAHIVYPTHTFKHTSFLSFPHLALPLSPSPSLSLPPAVSPDSHAAFKLPPQGGATVETYKYTPPSPLECICSTVMHVDGPAVRFQL